MPAWRRLHLRAVVPRQEKAAVTVGDDTASLGLVNLMLRYNQAQMQSLYASFMGDNMWETYGETTKSNIVESLENMFLMEQHMSDYGVSSRMRTRQRFLRRQPRFIEENDEKTVKAMNATQENVERLLTLYTVQSRMYNAIIAGVDTNVTDEEAAQKTVKYVLFSTAGSTDEDGNSVKSEKRKQPRKNRLRNFWMQSKAARIWRMPLPSWARTVLR